MSLSEAFVLALCAAPFVIVWFAIRRGGDI